MINLSDYYKSADGSNLIFNNGNSNGADIVIGTNDNYNLALEANGVKKLILTQDSLSGNISKTSFGAGSATGLNSFAIGLGKAFGAYSYAEGSSSALGTASHAEGFSTAFGAYSHAEGAGTAAIGDYSHVEGYESLASGIFTHSEGYDTVASGNYSHAQGISTATGRRNAFLSYTSSTRVFTFSPSVSGNFSYVTAGTRLRVDYPFGVTIIVASRNSSTGSISATTDEFGFDFTDGTIIDNSGIAGHAEGAGTTASGFYSHAEGQGSTASGSYSHAEGNSTKALRDASHAEGGSTTALGIASHAEGTSTVASGDYSHAEGVSCFTGRKNNFLTYTAATKTFTFASSVSANFSYVSPGTTIRGEEDDVLDDVFTITVASRNNSNGDIIATEDEFGFDSTTGYLIDNSGAASHAEGSGTIASGSSSHAEGSLTTASGSTSHAEGISTTARGTASHAAGSYAEAAYDRSWIWKGSTATNIISTTKTDQFMVSAAGGVYIPGNAGIGTAANDQALTVVGTVSTRGNLFSPNFATFVKNASYPTLSSTLTNDSGYFNSQGTFASPGGFIIKGHSPDYNTSIQNLPGKGTYGLWLQNVDNMDPGTTFASDGRAQVTHSMSFRAGISNFTAGSDHNHVQWQGAPSNSTQAWQMTNGGNATNVYGYQFPYTNRFMVHTLPQYQYNTTITAISGFIDTREANLVTGTDRVSGVKLLVSRDVSTGNYNLLDVGEVIGLTINPGLVGLIAATYNSQVTQISANATLSSFEFNAYIGNGDNWKPAQKGIQPISLLSRTDGGNPGVSLVTSQIGTDPNTEYVGLTGSYRGINKHMLARFTSSTLLTAYKTGAPLTLWIPPLMPSSSPIGTGIISSDKITSFAQGTFPTGVRSGYFDAYVINVSGADLEFALCNLMDSYSFENRSWPFSASGNAGWLLYGGSQDTVHRPTFGTTGFYFEREPWNVGSVNWLSGGMVKNVVLGTSESYGNFSYGLGWRGVVLGDKSGTFAGDYNTVFGNNSVALGGEGLISLSSTPYQAVVGKYNDPNNSALLVVGTGTSNTNRTNILEVEASNVTIKGGMYAGPNLNNVVTSTPISAMSGLYVDPVSGYAGFYTNKPIAPVDVRGTMKYAASAAIVNTNNASNFKVQGNYGYLLSKSANALQVLDLTQTTALSTASAATAAGPTGLYVNGRYAYVTTANLTNSVLQIFDISQITPVLVSTTLYGVGSVNAVDIYIQGNYAYSSHTVSGGPASGSISIHDISNPSYPKLIANISSDGHNPRNLVAQGSYLYYNTNTIGTAVIHKLDISDPVNKLGIPKAIWSTTPALGNIYAFAIRSNYLYAEFNATFAIYDLSKPINTLIGSLPLPIIPTSWSGEMIIQGNYVYISRIDSLYKIDITLLSAPRLVQSIASFFGISSEYNPLQIQGRYAYMVSYASSPACLIIVDLGGAYIQQLQAGGIKTDRLQVLHNTIIGNDIDVFGGAAFGQGFKSYKDSSVQGSLTITTASSSTSASNLFAVTSGINASTLFIISSTGNIGINTAIPSSALTVVGTISTNKHNDSASWAGFRSTQTSNFSAYPGSYYIVNTTSTPITGTLPISPETGTTITFQDSFIQWQTNNFTINRNGNMIQGLNENMICDRGGIMFDMTYIGGSIGWRVN